MLKSIVWFAALAAAPAWSLDLDGLRITIPEAEFVKARPAAVGGNGWYLYGPEPESKKEFGFPVRGYMHAFEKGQGCAAAVGFWKTSAADTEKLSQAIEATLVAQKMVKTSSADAGGARFAYWEGPYVYASVDRLIKGNDYYAISFQIALKTCPASAEQFKARPVRVAPGR